MEKKEKKYKNVKKNANFDVKMELLLEFEVLKVVKK